MFSYSSDNHPYDNFFELFYKDLLLILMMLLYYTDNQRIRLRSIPIWNRISYVKDGVQLILLANSLTRIYCYLIQFISSNLE